MPRTYSPSHLRANLFRLLDQVLDTGVPLEVDRSGRRLRIVPVERSGRLAHLTSDPDYLSGDPEEIVHLDWSGEWRP